MNVDAVMAEVAARLDRIDGLRAFDYPPDKVTPPVAIVTYPERIDFDATAGRGSDVITLPVVLLVARVSDRASKKLLTPYLAGSGVQSVKAVLEDEGVPSFVDYPAGGGVGIVSSPSRAGLPQAVGWGSAPFWLGIDVAADDWTPPTVRTPASSWLAIFNARTWMVDLGTNGRPTVHLFTTGGQRTFSSATAYGYTDGTRHSIGFHVQPNDGAGNRRVDFYTATSLAGPWTPHGVGVSQVGAESLFAGQQAINLGVGDAGTGTPWEGDLFEFELRAGDMDGTVLSHAPIPGVAPGSPAFLDDVTGYAWSLGGDAVVVGGAGHPAYTTFDSLRVVAVDEVDPIRFANVDYVAATFTLDVIGTGE